MSKVLTTTEVAKILQVSNRKVTQWIDNQTIKGFRMPGSTHRRVTWSELVNFMKANNYPLELLDGFSSENAVIEQEEVQVSVEA